MRQVLIAALLASAFVMPASAQRLSEGNVVSLRVAAVTAPDLLPGACEVGGVVTKVWTGQAFRAGQRIVLHVPCGQQFRLMHAAANYAEPVVLQDVNLLKRSRMGIARLDDNGELMWRSLPAIYADFGMLSGYRILDATTLPVSPT